MQTAGTRSSTSKGSSVCATRTCARALKGVSTRPPATSPEGQGAPRGSSNSMLSGTNI
nr:MAG: hypothetical protein [Molluscum contagiosum virus]